jgi:hypothetical protein
MSEATRCRSRLKYLPEEFGQDVLAPDENEVLERRHVRDDLLAEEERKGFGFRNIVRKVDRCDRAR